MDYEESIQPNINLKDKPQSHEKQNRDWLQTLPYPRIISGDGKFSFGNIVEMNADKWHGIYEAKKSESEDGFLILEPFINENIFSLSPNIFVDPKIAKIGENGEITPKFEEGWKILLPISEEAPSPPLSLDQLLDLDPDPDPLLKKLINLNSNVVAKHIPLCKPKEGDIPIEEDGVPLIFRGIDYKLMQKFIINGETKSGEVEQGLPQLDKSYELFFGDDPETAFAYAAWGSGYSQPTFEQPSYVFSIKMPDSDISRPSKHEVVLNTQKGGLRLEDIIHIYEIRPYKITSGLGIPLQISHDKKAMCMEEGWGNVSLAPRTFSVYREVKVEDTQ